MAKAYCVRCKTKVDVKDGKEVVWKNGMKALQGKCAKCGTKVSAILGKA